MPVAERSHDLLHFVPSRDGSPNLGLQGLRHVHGLGPALRAAEAQREMGAMLGPVLTVAPRPAAAAVGLGEGAKHDARGELGQPPQEGGVCPWTDRHRCHQ